MCRRMVRGCSVDYHLWERKEKSRIGQKEKLAYDAVSTKANCMASSKAGWGPDIYTFI